MVAIFAILSQGRWTRQNWLAIYFMGVGSRKHKTPAGRRVEDEGERKYGVGAKDTVRDQESDAMVGESVGVPIRANWEIGA